MYAELGIINTRMKVYKQRHELEAYRDITLNKDTNCWSNNKNIYTQVIKTDELNVTMG